MVKAWKRALERLRSDTSAEDVTLWLTPLTARVRDQVLWLVAPSEYVCERVRSRFLGKIRELALAADPALRDVALTVGAVGEAESKSAAQAVGAAEASSARTLPRLDPRIDPRYTFENFVEGRSNQLAKATAWQLAHRPGAQAYNPLVMYGGTGLGKTHLLHAIGNQMLALNPNTRVLYLRSEDFISAMVKALRTNTMDQFKALYRSVDALLIDDIQFFAGKDRTQEEFFHTFNALYDSQQQIVLTCDRFPKELDGLEPRLKSRFTWGLNVAVEPPDFETRVNILLSKAQQAGLQLDEEVAMFVARHMRSNVRDLEGALNQVQARANLEGVPVTVEYVREVLRDLLSAQERTVSLANIQRTVADFYHLTLADLLGSKRSRSIAWARQVAMALGKELTELSYKDLGRGFGDRDHTTVLHACRQVQSRLRTDGGFKEEWERLIRKLTG